MGWLRVSTQSDYKTHLIDSIKIKIKLCFFNGFSQHSGKMPKTVSNDKGQGVRKTLTLTNHILFMMYMLQSKVKKWARTNCNGVL